MESNIAQALGRGACAFVRGTRGGGALETARLPIRGLELVRRAWRAPAQPWGGGVRTRRARIACVVGRRVGEARPEALGALARVGRAKADVLRRTIRRHHYEQRAVARDEPLWQPLPGEGREQRAARLGPVIHAHVVGAILESKRGEEEAHLPVGRRGRDQPLAARIRPVRALARGEGGAGCMQVHAPMALTRHRPHIAEQLAARREAAVHVQLLVELRAERAPPRRRQRARCRRVRPNKGAQVE